MKTYFISVSIIFKCPQDIAYGYQFNNKLGFHFSSFVIFKHLNGSDTSKNSCGYISGLLCACKILLTEQSFIVIHSPRICANNVT